MCYERHPGKTCVLHVKSKLNLPGMKSHIHIDCNNHVECDNLLLDTFFAGIVTLSDTE